MTKEEKAEYDRKYRERKKDEIRLKKQMYCQSEKGRATQKSQRPTNNRRIQHPPTNQLRTIGVVGAE